MKLKNTLVALTAGLALVAGQATAGNSVADRVGSVEKNDDRVVPVALLVLAGALLAAIVINSAVSEDSESD